MTDEQLNTLQGELWKDYVVTDCFPDFLSDEVLHMVLDLIQDVFETMAWARDDSVRWDMARGQVTRKIPSDIVYIEPYLYNIFLYTIRHKAIDAVTAPLWNTKMEDGMSSPLQNKVEEIMLYLPPDEYAYLED